MKKKFLLKAKKLFKKLKTDPNSVLFPEKKNIQWAVKKAKKIEI